MLSDGVPHQDAFGLPPPTLATRPLLPTSTTEAAKLHRRATEKRCALVDSALARTGALAVDNACALPTARPSLHKLHSALMTLNP